MVIGYFLAILTAAADATASVLMRMAAKREPRERQFRLRLVLDLARSPVWLAGLGVSVLSYPIERPPSAPGSSRWCSRS